MSKQATPKTAMTLQVRNEGVAATLDIYDVIGDWGIDERNVNDTLKGVPKGVKRIDVNINSAGGDVFAGLTIYNILANHKAKVYVNINGLAASIASVIAMAGDEISIAENAFVMIHNPWTLAMGESADLRKTADEMDKVKGSLVKTYAARTGKDEADIIEMMNAETWLDADEAIEHGFADRMVAAKKIAAQVVNAWPEEYRNHFNAADIAAQPIGEAAMADTEATTKPVAADDDEMEEDEEEATDPTNMDEDEKSKDDEPKDMEEGDDEDDEDDMDAREQAAYDKGYEEGVADEKARVSALLAYFENRDPAYGFKAAVAGRELASAKADYAEVLEARLNGERDARIRAERRMADLSDEAVSLDDGAAISNDQASPDDFTAKHLKVARNMKHGAVDYLRSLNIDPGLLES